MLCSFTGYDACGHLSEETRIADKTAAYGIILSVFFTCIMGLLYVLALVFSIQARTRPVTCVCEHYIARRRLHFFCSVRKSYCLLDLCARVCVCINSPCTAGSG
jgi:hypothetical protein